MDSIPKDTGFNELISGKNPKLNCGHHNCRISCFCDTRYDIHNQKPPCHQSLILDYEMEHTKAEQEHARAEQLGLNCNWLIKKMDEIFYTLCPDQAGTWQQRAEMAVKKVKEIKSSISPLI